MKVHVNTKKVKMKVKKNKGEDVPADGYIMPASCSLKSEKKVEESVKKKKK